MFLASPTELPIVAVAVQRHSPSIAFEHMLERIADLGPRETLCLQTAVLLPMRSTVTSTAKQVTRDANLESRTDVASEKLGREKRVDSGIVGP